MNNIRLHQKSRDEPSHHKGSVVPVTYKTPAVLLM